MRRLSQRQAANCETAQRPRCRCRCGGALHGARRVESVTQLPAEDPHYAQPPQKRRRRVPEAQMPLALEVE